VVISHKKRITMDDQSIKENIAAQRAISGISQIEMAEKLGMDRNNYRGIEKGATKILNSHLVAIADILGVSTEKLVLGYEPMGPAERGILADYQATSQTRYDNMARLYEERIERLQKEVGDLRAMNERLKSQIDDKELIIELLKKRTTE